ncbi:MAG TPA: prolyl oligopeptidase family serine peptidase [Actinomycetota bacterium]|nr:prolyl oligopeptidase family serine peptidase [Actinomycetota bacterium]
MTDSYPRQAARTRNFNLGLPRAFRIADDGSRVVFLRSREGDDPVAGLWVLDVEEDTEREVFHPAGTEEHLTQEEIDRRERTGEKQSGVTSYTADRDLRRAVFVSGDAPTLVDLVTGAARSLGSRGRPFDPRVDLDGRRVAYETGGSLRALDLETGDDVLLAGDEDPDVRWGIAEFIAAEEMERRRGHWWAPDGERLIACRVDDRPVQVRHIASPIEPAATPRAVRYPQAGTSNAVVTLHVLGIGGSRVDVTWDRDAFEYVVAVSWTEEGPPLALVQSRDQRDVQVVAIDPDTGTTEVVWGDHDDRWTHITPGVPAWLPGGRLLTAGHRDDTRLLLIDDEPATPTGLQVDCVLDAGDAVWFAGTREPTELHVWRLTVDGSVAQVSDGEGQHSAVIAGDLGVLVSETVDEPLPSARLVRDGETLHTFDRTAETPVITGRPSFLSVGSHELRTAMFLPSGRDPEGPLPVLLDPYGGPHFGRVVRAQRPLLESQWFADQGFVVLVIDGRGTPYRGVSWEQSVHRSYLDHALEDQVDGLHAAADRSPFLDLSRVAIRGWSYGGYLTLGALLRRPDVFRAGISGAPVTDMRLYDTHYTERYLGMPDTDAEAYANADLIPDAPNLRGELLLIHGLADDNVYAAHSLRMSKALMEAGRPHAFIPLSGITHRPTDPAAAEAMLQIEVDFLRRALGVPGQQSAPG